MTTNKTEKPNSGQDVFIAQINTLAGVESQRYFVHQYWCNSGHQKQLLELGILFTDKEKAIEKTKLLLGIKEETKPTYRYEKVGGEWSVWEHLKEYENSSDDDPWFYKLDSELEEYAPIFEWFNVAEILRANSNLYRRIEVTERELELEAAYDLYIDSKQSNEPCMSKIIFISTEGREQEFWLRIVRKTGYRKQLNDVNGKG